MVKNVIYHCALYQKNENNLDKTIAMTISVTDFLQRHLQYQWTWHYSLHASSPSQTKKTDRRNAISGGGGHCRSCIPPVSFLCLTRT
jgi:hypothetical protein